VVQRAAAHRLLPADEGRPEAAGTLRHADQGDDRAQIYPFVVIGLETAMRKSEILSIRREHVDLNRRVIHIPKAKAGTREQPITAHLGEFLAAYAAALQPGNPWLFPSPGAKGGQTVRHTAIIHLVQAGVDLPTVKRISGHKTLAMVERCAHQNGSHIEAAMDKLQDRLKLAS